MSYKFKTEFQEQRNPDHLMEKTTDLLQVIDTKFIEKTSVFLVINTWTQCYSSII